jgi:ribonucleoside-diphosphate reductase subunit M1
LGVSDSKYTSQCDLGSINLANHDSLESIAYATKVLTRLLNRVIDKNVWSDPNSEKAGLHQRAIGIGVGGLANFFAKKKLSFTSDEAKKWNIDIAETIYKSAIEESNRMAEEENRCYDAWEGSRYERGLTYVDEWSPKPKGEPIKMLNSILVCYMPTAGTSTLLSINEGFEPFSSNMQTRATSSGEFVVANRHLIFDLEEIGLWNKAMVSEIVKNGGSVQKISSIPAEIRERYRTVWEIPQREIINMAADRQTFIDQSQSLNLYYKDPTYGKISGALRYGWEKGLKSLVYYTRTESQLSKPTRLSGGDLTQSEKPIDTAFSCEGGCSA